MEIDGEEGVTFLRGGLKCLHEKETKIWNI